MKILITGSGGLVGSAIVNLFVSRGFDVLQPNSKELNLLDKETVVDFFQTNSIDSVIHCAAKVGGIKANNNYPYDFLSKNLQMQSNIFDAAALVRIKKLVFMGSSCIYPKFATQPIKEDYLLTGKLEQTNSAYAIAKIAGIEAVKSVRKQLGLEWISVMPTNVYGINDNFNIEEGHVIPALMHKFHFGKISGVSNIELWGDGEPLREFINSNDLASAVYTILNKYKSDEVINVGSGQEISIKDLANLLKSITGYQGSVTWNNSLNGTPRKVLDSSKLSQLGWRPEIPLIEGLTETYKWFSEKYSGSEIRK